jgi:HSP20 family protein
MALARWSPFGESMNRFDPYRSLGDLRTEVNRLFGNVFGPAGAGAANTTWAPPVDMYATNDDLVVTAELPGVSEKDVHVSVTGDVLTIRGQRHGAEEPKDVRHYWGERWYGQFERYISLPFPVNAAKVKATFKDGVLTVTLPKAEEIKPKEIKVETF